MEHSDEVVSAVAERALPHWDILPEKVALVSRSENVVFRIDAEDGRGYALRIHRPGYHTLGELESEPLWTAALNEVGVGAPVAHKTRRGDYYAQVGVPGTDEVRLVGLIPWFEGVAMDEMIEAAPDEASRGACFERLGSLMAMMHEQASAWHPPPRFQRHSLDAEGFMGEAPFWGCFWEVPELTSKQRQTLTEARSVLHRRLTDYGKDRATYSMIHADLRSANILVHGDRVHVIDFDDAAFGWHLYDMAVALADHKTKPGFESLQAALIAGYRSRRAISDDDLALLPLFLIVRTLAELGWLHDRPDIELYRFMPLAIELACSRAEEFLAT